MAEEINELKKRTGLPKAAFANAADQIRIRTERFRQLYANNMQVGFSTWDLGITFGEITGEKDGQPIIEETVRVLMSREIAKVLSIILAQHIVAFEAKFGEIKIPVAEAEQSAEAESEAKDESAAEVAPAEAKPAE